MTKLEMLVEESKKRSIANAKREATIEQAVEKITWEYHDWIADINAALGYGADRADVINATIETVEEYIKTLGLEGADALIAYRKAMRYEINGGFDTANADRDWYPARRVLCDIYENASLWHSLDWDTSENMSLNITHNSKEVYPIDEF
jgi:hypothetical protein